MPTFPLDTILVISMTDTNPYTIVLYYKYTHIKDPQGFMLWHKDFCSKLGLKGRILIAEEGINGTFEGTKENADIYCEALRNSDFGDFKDIVYKISKGTGSAFPKLKVKVRKEIVSLSLEKSAETDIDPNKVTGIHLKPEELKKWYENNEDFVVVDMRNDYEFKVGRFKNSIMPSLENFRDLAKALPELEEIKKASHEGKKVLTVCTGGVRCEKASGFLVNKGFENVYQLDGGMHTYMEKFPGEDFLGALYVFDGRETVEFASEKGLPREIIGKCDFCEGTTEIYSNCALNECNKKILCCEDCQTKARDEMKEKTGSDKPISVSGSSVFCCEKCEGEAFKKQIKVLEAVI